MSASDLVPRVVLLVTNLEQENAELKSQLKEQEDKQLLVQLTGPNRTPIHYEGSLKDGYPNSAVWHFDFENKDNGAVRLPLQVPLSPFTDLEVWLGGIFIENFKDVDRLIYYEFGPVYSATGIGWGKFHFQPGGETRRLHAFCASIGPMTEFDFMKLTDKPSNLEEQIALHDELNLMIESIEFRKDKIPGIMSLLEKLEIPTTSDNDDDDDDDDDDDVDNDDNDDDDDGIGE